ncbi:MAG TPA: orotate phosphoribosyltransferase [Gammaproteobacteria bacterium]|jgi:orotate phosphoribosyltransferase|nr:orotate phosphoribosyltransferase [Gammaproteobacteria bacterium]|tara:strand:+ start:886 stop:1539 length:654 start_codon:yes stop_codon:yes gene_type:complete
MENNKQEFIRFALTKGVLKFGEFKLKSGRISPYFFDLGLFNSGQSIDCLGRFYAAALMASTLEYDMLFGPAYKGISITTVLSSALARDYKIDIPFAFNRKETKDHGEKGLIIGAPIEGRVLIVDDVITAGTAVSECARLITDLGGTLAGILISLDRQERGRENLSAVAEVSVKLSVPVIAIANLNDLIDLLESENTAIKQWLPKIKKYRDRYGVGVD